MNYKCQLKTNVGNDIHINVHMWQRFTGYKRRIYAQTQIEKKVHSLFLSPLFSTFFFYNCKYFFLLSPENSSQVFASEPVIFLV